MEEMNLSETTTEEEEPGRPSGAILSLALGKQRKLCPMFSSSRLKFPLFMQKEKYWNYRGADKSLARPGRTKAAVTEDFDVRISYL